MGKTLCPSGHSMWDGDGKSIIWAFRVGFIREFVEEHPDCKLDDNGEYPELYDCVYDVLGEDLDCWYCDECKGLTVFVDISRYDFKLMETLPVIDINEILSWEEFIAMRNLDFEDFQEYYEGMNPIEAIETYQFKYKYRVSPDKKTIYAINSEGDVAFGYMRSNYCETSPELTYIIKFDSGNLEVKPYEDYKGRCDIKVHVNQYAFTKYGRTIIIDEILEDGHLYRGRDMNKKELPEVVLKHEEILQLAEEICK